MATKTARFVRKLFYHEGWTQNANLYKLSEPAPVRTLVNPEIKTTSRTTHFVAVSSTPQNRDGYPETIVFMANEAGRCAKYDMLTQASIPAENAFAEALLKFGFTLVD